MRGALILPALPTDPHTAQHTFRFHGLELRLRALRFSARRLVRLPEIIALSLGHWGFGIKVQNSGLRKWITRLRVEVKVVAIWETCVENHH